MRASSSDNFEKLIPHRLLSLEQALEMIAEDECVEVTPTSVRVRKLVLDAQTRGRTASAARATAERRRAEPFIQR